MTENRKDAINNTDNQLVIGHGRGIYTGRSIPAASGEVLSAGRTAPYEDSDRLETVPLTCDLIKEIAMDIGKEVVFHIEQMYPAMFEAVSKNAKLSVRC